MYRYVVKLRLKGRLKLKRHKKWDAPRAISIVAQVMYKHTTKRCDIWMLDKDSFLLPLYLIANTWLGTTRCEFEPTSFFYISVD